MSTIPLDRLQSGHPPKLPLPFNANQDETIRLHPLSSYHFEVKEPQQEEDHSVEARMQRLRTEYQNTGMRRSCEGILVCHEHNHPNVLMLQIANAFFKLPGDYLQAEDDELEGFKRRLDEKLAPMNRLGEGDWDVGPCLAQWFRPGFESFAYPYSLPHISRPTEKKKIYLINLPPSKVLSVPKNMKLLAVPLFELYDNAQRYGPALSAIPHLLSRYNFEYMDENGDVVAYTPGGPVPGGATPKARVLVGDDAEMKGEDNGTN